MTATREPTPLDLPRHAWAAHPNYPHQVLLLRSHEAFRTISEGLVDKARAGAGRAALGRVFRWWKAGMHGHERYEEGKLYPFLEHRWGLDCDELSAGHEALAAADQAVRTAAEGELAEALAHHDAVLREHLDLEERRVLPALLALSREEFRQYSEQPLPVLLAEVPCHGPQGCRACGPTTPGAS